MRHFKISRRLTSYSATFDESQPLPHCFRKLVGLFASFRLGRHLNKISIASENDESIKIETKLPLDEKMSIEDFEASFQNKDLVGTNAGSESLERQWAQFHRCKNRITFVCQFIAVVSVQGIFRTQLRQSYNMINHLFSKKLCKITSTF